MLELARRAVEAHVNRTKLGPLPIEGLLGRPGACFVTLRIGSQLRGCIGTTQPTRSTLAEELVRNAVSACSRDTRFSPIKRAELPLLEYSVYVLREPEPVQSLAQLDPERYGVIVSCGPKKGVLLPGIPGIDTVDKQLKAVRQKAGIAPDAQCQIQRMEVVKYPPQS